MTEQPAIHIVEPQPLPPEWNGNPPSASLEPTGASMSDVRNEWPLNPAQQAIFDATDCTCDHPPRHATTCAKWQAVILPSLVCPTHADGDPDCTRSRS